MKRATTEGEQSLVINYPVDNPEPLQNVIVTSHYTWYNFIPLYLFEVFHKLANIYFLVVAILQAFPQISPLDNYSGFTSLLFMMCLSGVKTAYEDYRRHKADDQTNSRIAKVWTNGGIIEKQWGKVCVGDILYIESDEEICADIVLLESSSLDGRCRIETSALDGETNLKFKRQSSESDLKSNKMKIEITPPIKDMNAFSGFLECGDKTYSLDVGNFIQRCCVLRQTKYIYGIVVYAGKDTKVILNSSKPHFKYTEIDKFLDKLVIILSVILVIFCAGYAYGYYAWATKNENENPYLRLDLMTAGQYVTSCFSWVIVLNMIIPLCVYSSLDLVRFVLALNISRDRKMYEGERSPMCRNSDLVSTIGRITHIFSDKTGTLTKNLMTFCAAGFEQQMVGLSSKGDDDDQEDKEQNLERLVSLSPSWINWLKAHAEDEDVQRFLLTICLCNSASTATNMKQYSEEEIHEKFPDYHISYDIPPPEVVAAFPYIISFQTSSPDEIALLHLARECGFIMYNVSKSDIDVIINGELKKFERPVVFDFTSKRKRMSCITKIRGKTVLLMKGADNVTLARAKIGVGLDRRLREISEEGLRILLFSWKTIDDLPQILEEYEKCRSLPVDADIALQDMAERFEVDLDVFAVSGVEDELQDNVFETLRRLRSANVAVWMLTGDKMDTAINIASTSGLILKHDKVVTLLPEDTAEHFACLNNEQLSRTVLAIEGSNLNLIIENDKIADEFFTIAVQCAGVICARCEPKQKGSIIKQFMRVNPDKISLAIGDGGNDVDMIRTANVGVGVEGREGTEAVMSSDFSIPSFRHIARLMIVHGRWCANRSALLIKLTFYKNTMMALIQMLYGIFNGFSSTSAFDSGYISMYNLVLTIPQLFFICIFEEDVDARYALAVPQVYIDYQTSGGLSWWDMAQWYLLAALHAALIFFYSYFESSSVLLSSNGHTFDLMIFTQINGWTMMFVFTFVLLLRFRTFSILHVLLYVFCVIVYALIELIYSYLDPYMSGIITIIFSLPRIWFTIPIVVGTCVVIDLIAIYLRPWVITSISDSVAELEYAGGM